MCSNITYRLIVRIHLLMSMLNLEVIWSDTRTLKLFI